MILRMNPYLVTNGDGQEAVRFYEQALNAKVVTVQTFGDMPADPNHPIPPGAENRVMHALLKVGETDLMISDTMPGMEHTVGNNVTIAIHMSDAATAKAVYEALLEGGTVVMPLQETFWSPAYGQVTDKFGILFQISTDPKQ